MPMPGTYSLLQSSLLMAERANYWLTVLSVLGPSLFLMRAPPCGGSWKDGLWEAQTFL